jgi:stearoyl-CoA desaturase (Delta-9 desaturase)
MKIVEKSPAPVGTVRSRTSRISQVVTLVAVVVPPLGVFSAMGLLWGVAFHWVDVSLLVGSYTLCAFGITVGFHRFFTHKGFEARSPVKATLAILGCMTVQGPLTQWVTDHRKHHALSDREGDPHSPHTGHGEGAGAAVKGFVHAHVGWMFSNLGMEQGREYGKDLYEDRLVRTIDRLYLLWVGLSLGIPFAVGYAVGGTVDAGVEGLVWGGLIRIFLYQHATFAVNSICHMFGSQDYRTRDESRNNWLIAFLVFGEGWHNNHHAFPSSARHGLAWWQYDPSWWIIRGLEKIGLAWDVKLPTAEQMQRRRRVSPAELPVDDHQPLAAKRRQVEAIGDPPPEPDHACDRGVAARRRMYARSAAGRERMRVIRVRRRKTQR